VAVRAYETTPVNVALYLYGTKRGDIEASDRIAKLDLRRRASREFAWRVLTLPAEYPVREWTVVNCIPSFVPESADGGLIPAVVPYLEHGGKLCPIEVPANIDFEGIVAAVAMVMGCPAMIRTETHFPVRTDDRIGCALEQEVHWEQMKLSELRKEDEIRAQQELQIRQAWKLNDSLPKAVSRDALPPVTAFLHPEPKSMSQWEDKVKVMFLNTSCSYGVQGFEGWASSVKEGTNWDEAASEVYGVPISVIDDRTQIEGGAMMIIKCTPNCDQDEAVKAGSFTKLPTNAWSMVPIQVQVDDQRLTFNVRSSEPADIVEARVGMQFGIGVRFAEPRPTSWKKNQVNMMKKVLSNAQPNPAGVRNRLDSGEDSELEMTLIVETCRIRLSFSCPGSTQSMRSMMVSMR
jgi:hypothetical protein